ncbi:phosphatidylcholine:ceramide cholinephosphotransferase 2-like isoform X2 [Ischnura elegans]|uniref:phosphatidylcholine:ceramide cholinephosphotransferase 2-like isoform X2 n=1 Tax=Ischnura elegans TaxID=197161 RepID=UPI001ED87796|nr:phosphatidylcholine:ceramide cholinephosphotransferase 2-like isoform X2 [Ischnura elegans]
MKIPTASVTIAALPTLVRRMVLDPKSSHGDYGSFQSTDRPNHTNGHLLHHFLRSPSTSPTSHPSAPRSRDRGSPVSSTSSGGVGVTDEDGRPMVGHHVVAEEVDEELITGGGGIVHPMTQDVYQRQPLLGGPPKGVNGEYHHHHLHHGWEVSEGPSEQVYYQQKDSDTLGGGGLVGAGVGGIGGGPGGSANGVVRIDVPAPLREEPRFPKEKWKTFIAFLFLVINFILTTVSLALVHERVPDRDKYGPLPDLILDHVTVADWGLTVSEVLIVICTNTALLVLVLHRHRFIVMRRLFLLLGLLYLMRSITMFVTVLPVASQTYYCSPKANETSPFIVARRVLQLLSGFGLSINGQHTFCGDYIYSGHTVILVMSYLIIREYTPKWCYLVHWTACLCALTGVIMVLIARGHYTVDVLIAYYITTRLFWIYHTIANNTSLKQSGPNNFLSRVWWYSMFRYFEGNVGGPVPRQYEWPLPWPRRFLAKHPNRDS